MDVDRLGLGGGGEVGLGDILVGVQLDNHFLAYDLRSTNLCRSRRVALARTLHCKSYRVQATSTNAIPHGKHLSCFHPLISISTIQADGKDMARISEGIAYAEGISTVSPSTDLVEINAENPDL